MKQIEEIDCRIECLLCGKTSNLSMYAFRKKEKIVGWIFLCSWCNQKTDDAGYQLRWYFEDEEGKRIE